MFASAHPGHGVVVIAASHGGLEALRVVTAGLPTSFPLPVLVVLHRRVHAEDRLAAVVGRGCGVPVGPAHDGQRLFPGEVMVAPPSGLLVDGDTVRVRPRDAPSRHSGDALFTSAADHHGAGVISVVLSGLLDDAARGVVAIKSSGGRVLVQDPLTAIAAAMPRAALATGCADFALPPAMISSALVALTMARGAGALLRVTSPPWAALHPPGEPPAAAG